MSECLWFDVDAAHQQRVDAVLLTRRDRVRIGASAQVQITSSSTSTSPPSSSSSIDVTFVLGQFRVYCIARSDAQIVAELHLFDVKSVAQSDPLTDPLLVESKGENGLLLSLRCASTAAYDAFLHRFALSYRENLPQLPKFAACKFRLDKRRFPSDLDRHLQLGPCGGFVRSYECCCAFYNVVPRPDVCWTVDNLWAFNGVREFNMLEFDTLDRAHVKAVIFALRYNDWFDSFVLSDAAMPSGAWSALASCLAINQRFARLELSCVADLPKQSLAKLFAAMHENRACAIAELDISRNTLEPRDVSALALLLSSRLALQALSLNRCTLPSKSMVTIVNALTDDQQQHGVARHLRLLDLSHGNLAAAGASTSLGRALAAATQLDTLMLSYAELRCTELLAAAPSPFASVTQLHVRGCRDPTLTRFVRAFTNVRNLDISETLLSAADVCALLRPSGGGTTKIGALACSGMAESWSEQDVLDVLAAIGSVTSTLRRLEFDCNFLTKPKSAALRASAIEALCRCMGTATVAFGAPHDDDAGGDADSAAAGLHALSVRGDAAGRCAGASLLPLLLSLAGTTLRELDVRANALGDDGAAALARALQANASLRRLAFDNNGITLVGFRRLLDALERNFSLTDLTLPVIDGAAMMLKAQADAVGGAGLSLASTAASRFEQRSAPNVLAELHAIVMRNVQLTVLDATRKGKSAALPMRPRTRSHRAVVRPNGNNDGSVGEEDDEDELRVDLGGAARRDTTSVRVATPPTAARTRTRAPSSRASAKPPKVAAGATAAAAAVVANDDDLESQIRSLEAANDSDASALEREQAELEAEKLALEQEALEQERLALERELAGGDEDDAIAAERAALEAERAAIAKELAQLGTDEASTPRGQATVAPAADDDDDDNWDQMSPAEQAIRLDIEKLEIEIEQHEAKLVELFDREQQALNASEDDVDDEAQRNALDELTRERRRIHGAIEEAELRVESLKSTLAVGNFEGARHHNKPVKSAAPQRAPVVDNKQSFRAMLDATFMKNNRSAHLLQAAKMRERRASVMRPTFEGSAELARLLTTKGPHEPPSRNGAGEKMTQRGPPSRMVMAGASRPSPAAAAGAPLGMPARFRRGPAPGPAPVAGAMAPARRTPPTGTRLSGAPTSAEVAPPPEPTTPRGGDQLAELLDIGAREDRQPDFARSARESFRESVANKRVVAATPTPTTPTTPRAAPQVASPRAPQEPAPPATDDGAVSKMVTRAPSVVSPRAPVEPAAPTVPINTIREKRGSLLAPTPPEEPAAPTVSIDSMRETPTPAAAAAAATARVAQPPPPAQLTSSASMPMMPSAIERLKPSEARKLMRQGPAAPVASWGNATFRRNALAKPVPDLPRPAAASLPRKATLEPAMVDSSHRSSFAPGMLVADETMTAAAAAIAAGDVPPPPPEDDVALPPPSPPLVVDSVPPPPPTSSIVKPPSPPLPTQESARQRCASSEEEAQRLVESLSRQVDQGEATGPLIELGKKLKAVKAAITDGLDVVPEFQLPVPAAGDANASKLDKLKHILRLTLSDLRALCEAVRKLHMSGAAAEQQLDAAQALMQTVTETLMY